MPTSGGLSAAKRRATRELVEGVAIQLALAGGYEHVTVDAICAEAGISRSTFFNHFPTRETAIFGRGLEVVEAGRAFALLDEHGSDVWRGLFAVVRASLAPDGFSAPLEQGRAQLYATQPGALRHLSGAITDAQVTLTLLLDAWLTAHPEHARLAPERHADEAAYIVGAAITAALRISPAWLNAGSEVAPDLDGFLASLDDLRTVLAGPVG